CRNPVVGQEATAFTFALRIGYWLHLALLLKILVLAFSSRSTTANMQRVQRAGSSVALCEPSCRQSVLDKNLGCVSVWEGEAAAEQKKRLGRNLSLPNCTTTWRTGHLTGLFCDVWLYGLSSCPPTASTSMPQLDSIIKPEDDALQPMERRAAIRYAVGRCGSCHPALTTAARGIPAWWADISTDGLGLIVEQPFEPRTLLVVELDGAVSGPMRLRLARVRYVSPWGPKRWWLGCSLCSALTQEELRALISGGAD